MTSYRDLYYLNDDATYYSYFGQQCDRYNIAVGRYWAAFWTREQGTRND